MALHTVTNPIIQNALTLLRDRDSSLMQFRLACRQITPALILEASKCFTLKEIQIKTPMATCPGHEIEHPIVLIPILRAGLAMLDCAISLLPEAKLGYIGLERNRETARTSSYYENLPTIHGANVLILDPVIATGNSASYGLERVLEHTPKTISICCIIAATQGITHILDKFSQVNIYATAIDDGLNGDNHLVPGVGDFGDRFNSNI
jgi:uracil phosphoribosyltransferase